MPGSSNIGESDSRRNGESANKRQPLGAAQLSYVAQSRSTSAYGDDATFDIHRALSVIRRHLVLVILVGVIVFALIMAIATQLTPRYSASTDILLFPRTQEVVDVDDVLTGISLRDETLESEVEVLRSHELLSKVVHDLQLHKDPEWNPWLREKTGLDKWFADLLTTIKTAVALTPKARSEDPIPDASEAMQREIATARLRNAVTARRKGHSYAIELSVEGLDGARSADLANAIADHYLTDRLQTQIEATEEANEWLGNRLEILREQVLEGEAAVERYREEAGLLGTQGSTLTEQEVSDLNEKLIVLRSEFTERQARLDAAREQLARGSTGVTEALSSPVITNLRSQETELRAKLAEYRGRYGGQHPEMQRVRRELSDLEAIIARELNRIIAGLESEVRIAGEQLAAIEEEIADKLAALARSNADMVTLRQLERASEPNRALYEGFLSRFEETNEMMNLQRPEARIISRSLPPGKPSFPNMRLFIFFGFVSASAAGAFAIFIAEMFDVGLRTAEDVARRLGIPVLASVPDIRKVIRRNRNPADYLLERPLSSYAEAFRALQDGIFANDNKGSPQVVAVTSALPNEGKTVISHSLARMVAMLGGRTVLLDCDTRRRRLSRTLGIGERGGLLEILRGDVIPNDVVHVDEQGELHVIPLSIDSTTMRDMFRSIKMENFMEQLRNNYDFIVIDTPAILAVTEARTLARMADSVVLVARWRKIHYRAVGAALDTLRFANASIAGLVLSQVDYRAQAKHGYGDCGYFYKDYRKYYED